MRQFAVSLIEQATTQMMTCFLHILVHSISFDPKPLQSPVYAMLMQHAMTSEVFLHALYWDLIAASANTEDGAYVIYRRVLDHFLFALCSTRGLY